MNVIVSGVIFSAAMMRSPSFSRSASSTTTTISPRAMASTASSISANGMSGPQPSALASKRSTYFATMSTSRLTVSPGCFVPSVVTASVCGITATANPSARQRGHREADAVDGDRALLDDVAHDRLRARRTRRAREPSAWGVRTRMVPTASTWPCTRCPPSRSCRRTGRSRLTGSPGLERAEAGAAERLGDRVGGEASPRRAPRR